MNQYRPGDIIDFKFTSRDATGVPTALVGGTLAVYKSNSTTEVTSDVTLTANFDSRTGLNHVRVVTANDLVFYSDLSEFDVVLTAGTVAGVSVAAETIYHFRLVTASGILSPQDLRPVSDDFTVYAPSRTSGNSLLAADSPIRIKTQETVVLKVDYSNILAAGDYIASVDSVSTDNLQPITLGILGRDTTSAKITVANGTAGEAYTITVLSTTALGDTFEAQFEIYYVD